MEDLAKINALLINEDEEEVLEDSDDEEVGDINEEEDGDIDTEMIQYSHHDQKRKEEEVF